MNEGICDGAVLNVHGKSEAQNPKTGAQRKSNKRKNKQSKRTYEFRYMDEGKAKQIN